MELTRKCLFLVAVLLAPSTLVAAAAQGRPNILWLSFEDTSATNFGCYGNPDVKTPVIDDLAKRGILVEHACSVAPHCSPARSSIISGTIATTYGTDIHRQKWRVPQNQYFFPMLMRKAGYFCTNNQKTDYNADIDQSVMKQIWDGNSNVVSYNNPKRGAGQAFFSVFNNTCTHMTRVHTYTIEGRRKPDVDPATVHLPPFVPDLPEIRADYALHLEGAQDIDKWVKTFLDDLEQRKLADDTIIFIWSDHAGVLPRGKAFPYETGLHPLLIVYVPPKWQKLTDLKPGTRLQNLVGWEDLAPTVLTLAGLPVPSYMQGHSFLAPNAPKKEIQYGFRTNTGPHYDPIRTASDGHYKYIRSYTPYKPLGLRQSYQWAVPGQMAWDKAYHEGKVGPQYRGFFEPKPAEQLFDLATDPWEMKDLASDPAQKDRLEKFRSAVASHMRDTQDLGLFPRTMRDKDKSKSLYEWVRDTKYPVNDLIAAAETASMGDPANLPKLIEYLKSDRQELRFWGASGCMTLAGAGKLKDVPPELVALTKDQNEEIAATSAEALCHAGKADQGLKVLLALVQNQETMHVAASALEEMGYLADPIEPQLMEMKQKMPIRSILISLGKLPFEEYYGKKMIKQGIEANGKRMAWQYPSPDPAVNMKRPKEEQAAD
jgi:arylsulfatase A-like enzyme